MTVMGHPRLPLPPLDLVDPDGSDWVGTLPFNPSDDGDEAPDWLPATGYWMVWTSEDALQARLQLHLFPGRIRITEVWVRLQDNEQTGSAISAADIRGVPLGRIAEVLNTPNVAGGVLAAFGINSEDQPALPLGAEFTDDPEDAYRITGIEQTRRPDTFYRDVAMAIGVASARGSREAASVVARANDVPTTTVYRWIREARKRGVMAPSGQGPRRSNGVAN